MSKNKHSNLGISPGSLVYVGPVVAHDTVVKLIDYCEEYQHEREIKNLNDCHFSATEIGVQWLDVVGIHEPHVLELIGQKHHIHNLVLEDIMNTRQKPKLDFFDDSYLFLSLKMLHSSSEKDKLKIVPEHVSLILGMNYLISFQEQRTGDIFEPIINRLKESVGKTRKNGADYLFFTLLDLIVDDYLEIIEDIDEKVTIIEEQILKQTSRDPITDLYDLKRELALMRKYISPLRGLVNELLMEQTALIQANTVPYLRDVHDHLNQVIDTIDAHRELLTGLMDIHYSTLSNSMNSVMKTLTIYSAIFMPLTFIAGIYGMNFENMPELHYRNGYPYVILAMVVIAISLLFYFRRRKWL